MKKTKLVALSLVLALVLNMIMPLMTVIAVSSTTTLSVTFRDGNIGRGKVQYSLNDGVNWNDITANTENLNITVTGDNLRLKIIPNSGYSVDYAGIGLNLDGTIISQLSANDFESANGYSVPANIQSVVLEQVEFRAENGQPSGNNQNNENNEYDKITFQLDNASVSGNIITFQAGETVITATVTGSGYEFDGNNLKVNESDLNNVKLVLSDNFDGSKMSLKLHDGQQLIVAGGTEAIFDGLDFSQGNAPHLGLYIENNGGGQNGGSNTQDYQGNATATLNYSVNGVVEYGEGPFEGLGINFSINGVPYKPDENKLNYTEDTAYERDENGQLILNNNGDPIVVKDPETMQPMTEKTKVTITGDTIHYDSDSDKVRFVFMMNPGTLMTGLKINGQTINNLPSTSEELQACYTDHMLEIEVDNIDKADTYNIEIESRYPNSNEEFMGNFLWDYNPQGYTGPEDKILNATLTFVEAEYNGHKYTTEEEINSLGGVYIWNDAERKNNYTDEREGCGEAQFPVGTKLTVKIIPDAGYQLIDFGINGGAFDPQEEIGTYTFTVQGGPFHLQATIAQVDDVVKSNSNKVESGTITLGGEENAMDAGTARLDVDDVNLNQEQISNFEEAADGYDIKNYLDISLFNTVFKGKETASWDTEIKDLQNEATITLKLEDGVNGDEVVIVHEKHDGTYEIIPVEYDASTNTITFKTKSFSNYAIATKTSTTTEETKTTDTSSNPTTGDNIIMIISIFAIATFGVFTTLKVNKNRRIRKH